MILTRKRRLRLQISQQTALIPLQERLRQSREVFSRLQHMDTFRKAANVALFWSLSDEIPTHDFIDKWASRKNIYLPVIEGFQMHFARFTPGCKMVQGGLRILVPEGTPVIDPSQLDLMIVPGMAFDPFGGRLGKGKGYYDRFFENTAVPKIGLCLQHQLIGGVPAEPHDKKVDVVITPSGTFIAMEQSGSEPCCNHPEQQPHSITVYESPA